MCGICGLITARGDFDHAAVAARMNAALVHRGPDDEGYFSDHRASLAMRRLAIIDVATGQQPIANEDGTLHIVFNGEIYNFRELRTELEATGRHVLRTNSDTEVVLHAFEEFGDELPRRLEGMFALCIYRTTDRSCFLARDRFGEKPLYYARCGNDFGFASEPASLLQWPAVSRRIDLDGMMFYLRRAIVPAPWTTFADMRQIPPGHWLRWNGRDTIIRRYFEPTFSVDPALSDEYVAAEALRDHLQRAVKRQMVSEVPLSAFLSGGIDSSAIVAAMQRQSTTRVKTFTVRFEDAAYDESPIARRVAEHLGTDHHEFVVTNQSFQSEDLFRVVRHVGMPFADSSAIPTFFISRLIRDHVTVCLSGDGGDEMFGGYNSLLWNLKVDRLARWLPRGAISVGERALAAAARLPGAHRASKLRQARRAAHIAALPPLHRIWALGELFSLGEVDQLLQDDVAAATRSLPDDHFTAEMHGAAGLSRLRQMLYFRDRFSLPDDMLVKVDRMSMACSIEVRVPMLDTLVAGLAARLPDDLLIRGPHTKAPVTKYIVRQAVRPWLPEEVFTHPKTGFSIPLHAFQNRQYEELCRELLLGGGSTLVRQIMRQEVLPKIVDRGLHRKSDAADVSVFRATHHLWALVQLAAWAQEFNVTM